MGFASAELKTELDALNVRKQEIEMGIINLTLDEKIEKVVTVDDIKIHLKNVRAFILERNYPEIKKFIKDFVKKIVVSQRWD